MYEKIYTRECALITLQLWEVHQTKKSDFKWTSPAIYDVSDGSAEVYYSVGSLETLLKKIGQKIKTDPSFIVSKMGDYAKVLQKLKPIHKGKKILANLTELKDFFNNSIECWKGLDVAYTVPTSSAVRLSDQQLALRMRVESEGFLENTDRALVAALKKLFPGLGNLVRFITYDEIMSDTIPESTELQARSKHYVCFKNKIYTQIDFSFLVKKLKLKIKNEKIISATSVQGRVVVPGEMESKVRLILRSRDAEKLKTGEILVTTMTTPGLMPAMKRASAFITDEGGPTCHAAIMAREMGKPCIIGTLTATKIFQTGDLVRMDSTGTVTKLTERKA